MGWRRGRKANKKADDASKESKEMENREVENDRDVDEEEDEGKGFFACYLLTSLSPRHKGHTYIGFTVNPRRRIRQHNGEMRSGAWRTKRGRPWEMILCIYGFPTNVMALQFEWAWQHPVESLAVRRAAASFKSLSGIANKIKLAYTMLSLSCWENLNLTVNFFSTKYMKHTGGCPRLPKQMRVRVCDMDELPCYVEGQIYDGNDDYGDEEEYKEDKKDDDVSLSTSSDTSVDGIKGDACSFERESSFNLPNSKGSEIFIRKEPHDVAKFPKPTDASASGIKADACSFERESSFDLSNSKESDVFEHELHCLAASPKCREGHNRMPWSKSLSPCSEQNSLEWLQEGNINLLRQPSPSEYSNGEVPIVSLLFSPAGNVINLVTPSSCTIVGTKRRKVCSQIIDLTDSPIFPEL